MKKYIISVLILFIIPGSIAAQVSQDSVRNIRMEFDIPGLQITYANPHGTQSFYLGRLSNNFPGDVNAETRFQAASLTKVVAAYAFFKLYDRGLIDLDTPLYQYYKYDRLAENPAGQKVTARMVLTHRTGFYNWEGNVPTPAWRAGKLNSLFEPGASYKYSGEGFYYLQLAMEQVSGDSFIDLIRNLVLKPLGMIHSDIVWNSGLAGNTAAGHNPDGSARPVAQMRNANAAYTLYSTTEDYTRFVRKALIQGSGLKPETHILIMSKAGDVQKGDRPSAEDARVPVALAARMQLNEAGTAYWHTGSNPGFRAFFIAYPETGESLAVFTNTDKGFDAIPHFLKLFFGNDQTYWMYEWRHGELD